MAEVIYIDDLKENLHQTEFCHSRAGGNPSPNKHSARAEMGPRLRGDDTVGRGEDKVKHTHDNQDLNNLFQTFMHQTNNKLQSIQKDFQQQLSHYVLKVVSQLFLEHVETPKAIELMITRALQEVSHYPEIMVHMHPRDIELLSLRKLHIKPDARQNLKFVADETLVLGGVKIQTPQGILDASLETQIQRLKNAVLKIRDTHYV